MGWLKTFGLVFGLVGGCLAIVIAAVYLIAETRCALCGLALLVALVSALVATVTKLTET